MMTTRLTLLYWAAALGLAGLAACSSGDGRDEAAGDGGVVGVRVDASAFGNSNVNPPNLSGRDASAMTGAPPKLASLRIDPADDTLVVGLGATATKDYKVFATFEGDSTEQDITDRSVFWVSDGWQSGAFANNEATFETAATDPRGGRVEISAAAANADGTTEVITTTLLVVMEAELTDPRDDGSPMFAIPSDPAALFGGTEDPSRKPSIVYPNDEVLLPPNLRRLDVHWRPGPVDNTLFEVVFKSESVSMVYFMRCGVLQDGGCLFELDEQGFRLLADSNRAGEPVTVRVRGTDDAGALVGVSDLFTMRFAETNVEGGIYYWTTSGATAIMRFDFGGTAPMPEVFLEPGQNGLNNTCVGCHAISPDGTKVVASHGGQGKGQLTFINDLSVPPTDPGFLTKNADGANPIQFASFNPDGSRFVAIYGDGGGTDPNMLWFHDGTTGDRIPAESFLLAFEPDHPNWSPDGEKIAVTRVGIHNTSQRPLLGSIEMLSYDSGTSTWGTPVSVAPEVSGLNRYNPNFLPGSELLIYNESTCPGGDNNNGQCDADDDPTAKTWAVTPAAGATPILLGKAAAPGIEDGAATDLSDTFPRSSPFESTASGSKVYWVTISSRRRAGLLNTGSSQLLWMFAVDPDALLNGTDGSYPAFYLPFQDLNTSNHIAQWTQRIVSDDPPPPPPSPPPPPDIPVPPPPIE